MAEMEARMQAIESKMQVQEQERSNKEIVSKK